jgi:putative nucleotidyltransferase with HDIG domain
MIVTGRQRILFACFIALIAAVAAVDVSVSTGSDWEPPELVALLFVLAVGSDMLTVELRNIRISGSFTAIVLAMVLLGPVPASAIGALSVLLDSVFSRRPLSGVAGNVAIYSLFPLLGGLFAEGVVGDGAQSGLTFAAVVLLAFILTNFLNFAFVAIGIQLLGGPSFLTSVRSVLFTVLPSEFATGLLCAAVAYSYGRLGVAAIGLAAVVLFVFQYLLRTGVNAYERGEELATRTRELASLQVGLISTVLQTLSMRDAMTARHSAAVARYSREVARLLGLGEREQELIHTAGLLHDIGKFIFPDAILIADRKLTDDEWEIVKLHPEQGARLVQRIEGYGPVAEIILSHHERFAGGGYPNNLAGEDIPLGSRILSVADTYDVMTSRDSYRRPVSSQDAIAELRRVAGTQLDPNVVETFVRMIESGRVGFRHADEADFEQELAFEKRVADYARPRVLAA